MDTLVQVTFKGPVKTAHGWHKAGDTIPVTMEEARQLEADGVVADITVPESVVMEGFDEAVAAKAQLLAEAMAPQLVAVAVAEEVAPLEARIKELEAVNAALKAAAKAPAKPAAKATAKPEK